MIIPRFIYIIFVVFVLLAFLYGGGWLLKKKNVTASRFKTLWVILLLVACIGLHNLIYRIFPAVFTVTACGSYSQQVLVMPTKFPDGLRLSLGNRAYLNNLSAFNLRLRTVQYGSPMWGGGKVDVKIPAHTSMRLPLLRLNYIFEQPPESVTTKSSGEMAQYLDCDNAQDNAGGK